MKPSWFVPYKVVTWAAVAGADLYDLEYGDAGVSTANPVAMCTSIGTSANITGLTPNVMYWFKVRAHVDGIGGYGNDTLWSVFSPTAKCMTIALRPSPARAVAVGLPPSTQTKTRYQLIYRITETLGLSGAYRPPDFLRDHNSADALGSASFLTWAVLQGLMSTSQSVNISTITEYCVEMVAQPWAAYMSCVPGGNYTWAKVPRFQAVDSETCYCAKGDDRYITHRDMCTNVTKAPFLTESCPLAMCEQEWSGYMAQAGGDCRSCSGVPCSTMSATHKPLCTGCNQTECARRWALSRTEPRQGHQGQRRRLQGWELPCNCSKEETKYSLNNVGSVNLSFPPGVGTWYSTPKGGQCKEGQPIGTAGCTWR